METRKTDADDVWHHAKKGLGQRFDILGTSPFRRLSLQRAPFLVWQKTANAHQRVLCNRNAITYDFYLGVEFMKFCFISMFLTIYVRHTSRLTGRYQHLQRQWSKIAFGIVTSPAIIRMLLVVTKCY